MNAGIQTFASGMDEASGLHDTSFQISVIPLLFVGHTSPVRIAWFLLFVSDNDSGTIISMHAI